jgi:hypothetical protein
MFAKLAANTLTFVQAFPFNVLPFAKRLNAIAEIAIQLLITAVIKAK